MRVMVIGGTRFIGLETVSRLNALDHEVVVFHRGVTAAALPRNVQEILGDRYHLADRAGQLKDLAPDVVLDMIPLGEEDTRADNYEKILVERAIMGNSDLPGTVLRLPAVYGPRDSQHRLFPYLKRMDDTRPAIILDEVLARWRWSRIYVGNAGSAITLAVTDDRAGGRVYNIAEPEALTEAEWIRQIGLAAGWSG